MFCVVLQPLRELAFEAVQDIILKEAITTNDRVKMKRFILWDFFKVVNKNQGTADKGSGPQGVRRDRKRS